jgi:hypothetical protein
MLIQVEACWITGRKNTIKICIEHGRILVNFGGRSDISLFVSLVNPSFGKSTTQDMIIYMQFMVIVIDNNW